MASHCSKIFTSLRDTSIETDPARSAAFREELARVLASFPAKAKNKEERGALGNDETAGGLSHSLFGFNLWLGLVVWRLGRKRESNPARTKPRRSRSSTAWQPRHLSPKKPAETGSFATQMATKSEKSDPLRAVWKELPGSPVAIAFSHPLDFTPKTDRHSDWRKTS